MILFTQSLLFVHNPKTAGTSLLKLLSEIVPGPVHRAGVLVLGTHHPHLLQARDHAARVAGFGGEGSVILAVIRRPLDREQSMYLYYRNVLATSATLDVDLPDTFMRRAVSQAAAMSFAEWIRWQASEFGHCDLWHSRCYYQTPDGQSPENLAILRFENLEDDLSRFAASLGLVVSAVPRLNITDRSSIDLHLSKEDHQVIKESYRWMAQLPDSAFVCGHNTLR